MVPVLRVPLSCSRLGTGWQHSHWLGITEPHFLASTGGHSIVVTLGCAMKHSFDAVKSFLAASLSKILVNWSYACSADVDIEIGELQQMHPYFVSRVPNITVFPKRRQEL